MTREQFEHAIRAAGAVLGISELLVIGSQAVHGSMTGPLPIEATRSVEVDVAIRGNADGRLADLIDGSIGEASMREVLFTDPRFVDTPGWSHSVMPVGDAVYLQATAENLWYYVRVIPNWVSEMTRAVDAANKQRNDPRRVRERFHHSRTLTP